MKMRQNQRRGAMVSRLTSVIAILLAPYLLASPEDFKTGPVITGYGEHAAIAGSSIELPAGVKFSVAFDVGEPADAGKINRHFNSLARFINMHVANGVAPENLELALVVHGKAALDLLTDKALISRKLTANANADLLRELQANNVKVYLCGQTAQYFGIEAQHLLPGVALSLSAMSTHALLQQRGYTLNPF